ncbi:membrane protein [Nocardia jinanensis]|uniref:Membrane protein n=2 Tax=Nocardia jinanensis TaxID=382504 RepID=A0A917RTJ8_9NOCA|nr:membrane protein [Nocardia jinanensis]
MSTVVQPCARCGTRWAVQGPPMHWCPRCRGVLLSPGPIDAPPERRNYRWVARRPGRLDRSARTSEGGRRAAGTPRYSEIPRWGLRDRPVPDHESDGHRARPLSALTRWTHAALLATAVLFAVSALAEAGRYLILLRNRTRLIEPPLLWFSDALVNTAALFALIMALVAAFATLGWLIEARRVTFAAAGGSDPRSPRMLALGCLIPVINLIWPGVFLTEVVSGHADPRARTAVRIWWAAWVFGGMVTVAALYWRTADSLQAKADGVLFTAFTDVAAAGVAVLTLWVVRTIEGRDLRGRNRLARRWVVAVDPATPLIEPVHPGPTATVSTAADADGADSPDGADRAPQEVVAK